MNNKSIPQNCKSDQIIRVYTIPINAHDAYHMMFVHVTFFSIIQIFAVYASLSRPIFRMSQRTQLAPNSPAMTPAPMESSVSPDSNSAIPTHKRPLELDLSLKRVKLNTPEVSLHLLSPAPVESGDDVQNDEKLPIAKSGYTGDFGIFNNPIIIGNHPVTNSRPVSESIAEPKSESTPESGLSSNTETRSESITESMPESTSESASELVPKTVSETASETISVPFSAPIIVPEISEIPDAERPISIEIPNVALAEEQAEDPPKKLTKRERERIERQKQRELEKIERDRKKEEELRLKKEERERKERERLAKKEQLEKEKERKREEERIRREEKKKKLEEEKKRKEEERKLKEEEKRQKEEEKRQKEEEKRQKEEQKDRNQMKISSFFNIRPASKNSERPATPKKEKVETVEKIEFLLYEKQFLPFFIKQNVTMAPSGQVSSEKLAENSTNFDLGLQSGVKATLEVLIPKSYPSASHSYTSSEKLLEALNSSTTTEKQLHQLVQSLPPIKYLQFYENSKPPYIGTWCSEKHLATQISAANPLETSLTGYDYNYDSDLDWQDGDDDEGEDIDELEDGDDEEDDDDDDMEDFVDNNDTTRRKVPVGNILAVNKWNSGLEEDHEFFDDVKYERLEFEIHFPIDPLKDYWPKVVVKETSAETGTATPTKAPSGCATVLTPLKPAIKDAKVVAELVKFIEKNSDFTIGTLAELAKKEFKTYTKSILKHTIQEIAIYNKKKSVWEIKS